MSAAVALFAGCQKPERPDFEVSLPPAPAVVAVRMLDDVFEFDRTVAAGRTVFQVRNDGKKVHRLALLPLADDLPPIREQLTGPVRQAVAPFAGVRNRVPGATGSFAVDLLPGQRYALLCFVRDPDGTSHALKGMAAEFRTPNAPGAPERPTTTTSPPTSEPATP